MVIVPAGFPPSTKFRLDEFVFVIVISPDEPSAVIVIVLLLITKLTFTGAPVVLTFIVKSDPDTFDILFVFIFSEFKLPVFTITELIVLVRTSVIET